MARTAPTLAVAANTSDDTTAFVLLVALIVLVPAALALLRTDPQFAIACGVLAAYFGILMAPTLCGPPLWVPSAKAKWAYTNRVGAS